MSISRKVEEDDELQHSSSKPLLPTTTPHHHSCSSSRSRTKLLLVISTCIALSVAVASAGFLLFSSTSSSSSVSTERPLSKLQGPVVILISWDGFRFGYQFKTKTPNIDRLIKGGTEAEQGLIPVFPTLTFPNHYSIVTGLYPPHHGIVNNRFTDPETGHKFSKSDNNRKWWLGQPLWETLALQGKKSLTYFWPGSEVRKGPWNCPDGYCKRYKRSVCFDHRIDTALKYLDLDTDKIPSLMALYFEDPDKQGHEVGPDDPEITKAVAEADRLMGKLITGLEDRGIFEDVHIIMVGDHGMVGNCDTKMIYLDDLAKWIKIPGEWVESYGAMLAIRPPSNYSSADVVAKMRQGLKSGEVSNGEHVQVCVKEKLPSRLHYSGSDRIPPVIGLVEEGFKVRVKKSNKAECGGSHGYDNEVFSMRSVFIGHGPRFGKGKKVASFENVEIYNVVTEILDVEGPSNDGSASFPETLLLPKNGQ